MNLPSFMADMIDCTFIAEYRFIVTEGSDDDFKDSILKLAQRRKSNRMLSSAYRGLMFGIITNPCPPRITFQLA